MKRTTKILTAASVVIIATVGAVLLMRAEPAYAFEQTVEAIQHVQYMHLIKRDEDGATADERWIEIGPDGHQIRYRQDTPPRLVVIEDGTTVCAYHKDKNTVVLHDPKDMQYQWIGDLGRYFRDLAGQGTITIEENVPYQDRRAHHVRWLTLGQDAYIDPQTKLPIAIGGYEISYEVPPEGTFQIVLPEGVSVVDKRLGTESTKDPEWMVKDQEADEAFTQARHALDAGEYQEAIELFERCVKIQPRRNWAWFWLGRAQYELGDYDTAIASYDKAGVGKGLEYACLARGLAYWKKGAEDQAKNDIGKALPAMILALRHIKGATMFDYADDPRYHDGRKPSEEVSFVKMINRLRIVSGRDFEYDPNGTAGQKEAVIVAWEKWSKESPDIRVDFNAKLVPIPEANATSDPQVKLLEKLKDIALARSPEQALDAFKQARANDVKSKWAWLMLGCALFDGKHDAQALDAFRRMAEFSEDDVSQMVANAWQGTILDLLERREEALQCYKEALEKCTEKDNIHFDLYGIVINRAWLEERLEKPFKRK